MHQQAEAAFFPDWTLRARVALARVRDQGLLACVVAVYVTVLCWRIAGQVQQDTWLMLVAGRDVVHNGLPGHDHLTYWTAGVQWVDQQWLGQGFFYALTLLGGLKAALVAHAALLVVTFTLVLGIARRHGASVRATAWIAVPAVIPIVSGSWQMRTQVLGLFFFALLLWLLLEDERGPSARVYWTLPLLVIWANVHGSVVVGAFFLTLYALAARVPRRKRTVLVAAAWASLFVTPYGLEIVDYYRATLVNPGLTAFVTEWQSTTLRVATIPVYALIFGGVWLLAGRASRASLFQKLAFLASAALALLALRNLGFLGLAAIPLLAPVLDEVLPRTSRVPGRVEELMLACATLLVVVSVSLAWRSTTANVDESFPPAAAAAVSRALEGRPDARVAADVKFADWLLWARPDLAGRVAYDARFELLSYAQLRRIYYWTNQQTANWRTAAAGARVVVLNREATKLNEAPLLAEPGTRRIYRDAGVSVLERETAANLP